MKIKITLNRVVGILALFLVLWGGKMIWQQFGNPVNLNNAVTEASFQYWFWQERGPDLAVQAGLIFAGALGIAALLPGKGDKEP